MNLATLLNRNVNAVVIVLHQPAHAHVELAVVFLVYFVNSMNLKDSFLSDCKRRLGDQYHSDMHSDFQYVKGIGCREMEIKISLNGYSERVVIREMGENISLGNGYRAINVTIEDMKSNGITGEIIRKSW